MALIPSPGCSKRFRLELPATPLAARTARRTARGFAAGAGLSGERLDEIELAVAEACANAVVHGRCDAAEPFLVDGCVRGTELILRTTDRGRGIDDDASSPRRLGAGIPLIAALSDDLRFESPADGGTRVRMVFSLARPGRLPRPAPRGA